MTEAEFKSLMKVLRELWPRWDATDAEVQSWRSVLEGRDYATCERAVMDHHAESTWQTPKLPAVRQKVISLAARPRPKPISVEREACELSFLPLMHRLNERHDEALAARDRVLERRKWLATGANMGDDISRWSRGMLTAVDMELRLTGC